jgi:hypothetical protein
VFRRRERKKPREPDPAVFMGLRQQVLELDARALGWTPSDADPRIFAALMEIGYPEAVATVVAVVDGTTSLYLGSGGGILGGGDHPQVVRANVAMRTVFDAHRDLFASTEAPPLPQVGEVRFHALTFDGPRTAVAPHDELMEEHGPLVPLFAAGHDVITELRLIAG